MNPALGIGQLVDYNRMITFKSAIRCFSSQYIAVAGGRRKSAKLTSIGKSPDRASERLELGLQGAQSLFSIVPEAFALFVQIQPPAFDSH